MDDDPILCKTTLQVQKIFITDQFYIFCHIGSTVFVNKLPLPYPVKQSCTIGNEHRGGTISCWLQLLSGFAFQTCFYCVGIGRVYCHNISMVRSVPFLTVFTTKSLQYCSCLAAFKAIEALELSSGSHASPAMLQLSAGVLARDGGLLQWDA
eukprot:3376369-Amphidinium_carterae.2